MQAFLNGVGGLVVQEAPVPGLAGEDQLAGKEGTTGEVLGHGMAEALDLIHRVGADGETRGRRHPEAAGQFGVTLQSVFGVGLERVDCILALESALRIAGGVYSSLRASDNSLRTNW